MKKYIAKRIFVIMLSIIIIFALISSITKCFALGDVTDFNGTWGKWKPSINNTDALDSRAGTILGVIQTIGIIVSVISLSLIGIKFILGSVEEKANYKKALAPWCFGAVMIFAVTTIPSIIYDTTKTVLDYDAAMKYEAEIIRREEDKVKWPQFIKGYDAAVADAYKVYQESGMSSDPTNETITSCSEALLKLKENKASDSSLNSFYLDGYYAAINLLHTSLSYSDHVQLEFIKGYCEGAISAKEEIQDKKITIENHEDKYMEKDMDRYFFVQGKNDRIGHQACAWLVEDYHYDE